MFLLGLLVLGLLPVALMSGDPSDDDTNEASPELSAPDVPPDPSAGPASVGPTLAPAEVPGPSVTSIDAVAPDAEAAEAATILWIGGTGDDILTGDDGDDTLLGQGGADTIDGGTGNDLVDHSGAFAGPTASVRFQQFVDGAPDLLTGGDGDDVIVMDSLDTARGGAGADEFNLHVSPDAVATIADFDPAEDRLVVLMPPGPALGAVEVRTDDTGATLVVDGADVARLDGVIAATAALSPDNQFTYVFAPGAQIMVLRFENITS